MDKPTSKMAAELLPAYESILTHSAPLKRDTPLSMDPVKMMEVLLSQAQSVCNMQIETLRAQVAALETRVLQSTLQLEQHVKLQMQHLHQHEVRMATYETRLAQQEHRLNEQHFRMQTFLETLAHNRRRF